MLTVEAIVEIRKIMEAGQSTEIIVPALEPGVYYTHLRGSGVQPLEKHVVPLGPRAYWAYSVADLVAAMQLFGKSAPLADTWFVAVGCSGVRAVANDTEGDPRLRHEVFFSLCRSGQFAELKKLASLRTSIKPMDLLSFIRFLRVELADAVPPAFLQSVREVRYSSTTKSNASVHTGRESLGSDVLREATLGHRPDSDTEPRTAPQIPNEVTMAVNVYDELPGKAYTQQVRCILDVQFGEAGPGFSLIPVSGELSKAERETEKVVVKAVAEALERAGMKDVGVICGWASVDPWGCCD